ncbi:hypothetical protein CK203_103125 [Vitis vinifera]|uniref:Integrase zinc-binding domain-containing protein n=1 Tax=Vitis vinifera TaxID=29760 RepID=A0A438DP79_VITVI|nr:hypothetical protein CK203_103125 [Vitis vinifera]
MADFVLEYSRRPDQHHESGEQEWWTLRVDGASRSSGSGVGLLLQSPTGEHLEQPSGWDSPRLTMKQNTRPSCPDWTSPCAIRLQTPNLQRLATSAASLPSEKPFYCLSIISPDRTLPEDPKQAHKIRVQAARFTLIGGHLYKRSFTGPYLRCLGHSEAQYVLAELHEGICGNHTGGRSLAHRAHSQGYYWPTMKKDAAAYVQKCDKCQRYAPIPHMHQRIKSHCIQEFLFGIEYPEFILHATLSSKQWPGGSHKQNSSQCLKKRLEQAKGKWVEELPGVLWAYRTTPGRPTGNTPFALTYGMDAVIPTEIGLPTIRTDAAKQKDPHGTRKKFGLGRRSQRKRIHPDGRLSTKSISALQSKSQAQKLQKWYAST